MENLNENQDSVASQPPPVTVNVSPEEKKGGKGCFWWGVGIFAFLFFMGGGILFIAILASALSGGSGGSFASFSPAHAEIHEQFVSGNYFAKDKIAVIDIRGIIVDAQSQWGGEIANATLICTMLAKAAGDPSVKAVVLKVDTPGGEVTASDMIYHDICELRKNTGKPVVVSMGSVAASGGVYVSVGSDYIIANKLTTTGSIGVIAQAYNYTELFKKIGLQAEVYKSGPMKDLLNGARPRTQAEVKIMDGFIDEVYDEFVKIVAENRANITEEQIKNGPIGDGRFYSGKKALEYGLVDELGYFEDAVTKAASMSKMSDYQVVSYQQAFGLANILFGANSKPPELKVQLPGASQTMELPKSGKFFLLPAQW